MSSESNSQADIYRDLIKTRSVREDSIHEMINRHGVEILDRDFPYLIAVAKGLRRSADRTARRRRLLLELKSSRARSTYDPLNEVTTREDLRATLEALAELPDIDATMLWWHALGYSDREIAERWIRFEPDAERISEAAIRQRRSRSRKQLKAIVQYGEP